MSCHWTASSPKSQSVAKRCLEVGLGHNMFSLSASLSQPSTKLLVSACYSKFSLHTACHPGPAACLGPPHPARLHANHVLTSGTRLFPLSFAETQRLQEENKASTCPFPCFLSEIIDGTNQIIPVLLLTPLSTNIGQQVSCAVMRSSVEPESYPAILATSRHKVFLSSSICKQQAKQVWSMISDM